MLRIENLCKNFGKKQIFNNLNLELNAGIYGLLGPNGAGKTTLIRCITQLYPTDANAISYNGVPVQRQRDYLTHIGYLPQKFGLFRDLTVYDALEVLAVEKKIPKGEVKGEITRCVEAVNLSDRLNSKVKTLSGGMIRRLGIAQVFLGDPDIMIFDEPTAGLDPEERLRFQIIISQLDRKKTVLISTHIVSDIEEAGDNVVVLNNGSVALEGTCAEVCEAANGKVYLVPRDELGKINEKYFVQSQFSLGGKTMCRIISSAQLSYENDQPTLEDGYMSLIKEV